MVVVENARPLTYRLRNRRPYEFRYQAVPRVLDFEKGRLLVDEFGELQGPDHAVEFNIRALPDPPNQPERELPAHHRQRLQ